ncbi:MAG: CPBP family intramembrane metalloprotease [Firmicutes bacterium]|nr:CPBP family intramembrane metalloprotease [Bacillota bacterium]
MPKLTYLISFFMMSLLVAYLVFAQPVISKLGYQRFIKLFESGAISRVRYYLNSIMLQWVMVIYILVSLSIGSLPVRDSIGLRLPSGRSAEITIGLLAMSLVFIAAITLRSMGPRYRERVRQSAKLIAPMLPQTSVERGIWIALSSTAGISEEIIYRGFLMFYLLTYLPGIPIITPALISSAIFALGHTYQGITGIIITFLLGIWLAAMYVLTGSLILSMVVHALLDVRILLIWRPDVYSESE